MPRNKSNKKITELEFSFNDISFCNDKKFKPFIETFVQEPENIEQQNLGTIFGIFEITDNSEDSSYITNYLISVIKKEYFSVPKRGAIESFEAALHKANLALSKLAEHGNVAWIGRINVLCAAVEKYNLHLTQIGSCHAFLLREKNLTDIGENLSSPEDRLNPLKTFTDVSSGKLEENDRIILSADNICDIFSFEEIKKSAHKFPGINFVRFLKTALVNELDRAAVLIVDVKKKEKKISERPSANYPEAFNAFSSSSFVKTFPKEPMTENMKEEIKEELQKSSQEIEDVRHGHIYIKEAENLPQEKPAFFSSAFFDLGCHLTKSFIFLRKKIQNIPSNLFFQAKSFGFKSALSKINVTFVRFYLKSWIKKITNFGIATKFFLGELVQFFADTFRKIFEKSIIVFRRTKNLSSFPITKQPDTSLSFSEKTDPKEQETFHKTNFNFLPSFSRIKNIFAKFSYEQKIYAAIILLLIFVVPYMGVKIERRIAEKKAALIEQNTSREVLPLEQDINVIRLSNLTTINQDMGNISKAINLNGKMFFVGSSGIFDLEKNQSFSFPSEVSNIQSSVGMDDLNLILLLTKTNQVFSFSPASKKFQPNLIEIPVESDISISGTYLTYLYLLDKHDNQIYRYPRAEGGFGAKVNWLRDTTDLSKVSDISVNENIFAVSPNEITKLFKGKRQDFSTEETATPIVFDKIYIAKNNQEIYILDKINSRIVQLNPEGNILNQYYNEKIREASSFSVDENNTVYFSVGNIIYSFKK